MAGIVLTKGAKINLAKEAPGLTKVRVGLAWGKNRFSTGAEYDLDSTLFMLQADPSTPAGAKLIANEYFIFYNNLTDPEHAVKHSGDNKDGGAEGDDEVITVDLSQLNSKVDELSFIATIFEAHERKQNFGQIPGGKITLYNDLTGAVIASYSLEDDFSTQTAVQFGSLKKRNDGDWAFAAAGNGYDQGLDSFVLLYGGTLA